MITSIFIFLFAGVNLQAQSSDCPANIKELAQLHLALDEDPSMAADLLTVATTATGAVAGSAIGQKIGSSKVNKVDFNKFRTPNIRMSVAASGVHTILQVKNPIEPITTKQINRSIGEAFSANDKMFQRKGLLTVSQIDNVVDVLETDNRKFTQSERLKLTKLLMDYDRGRQARKASRAKLASLHSDYKLRATKRMSLAGGAIGAVGGILVGQAIKSAALSKACGQYGVEKLIGYFQVNLLGALGGSRECVLSQRGASLLLAGNDARRICDKYPQIEEALTQSIESLFSATHKQLADKNKAIKNPEFQCKQRTMTYDLADVKMKLTFNEQGTDFTFQQQGSGAGPNSGSLRQPTPASLPEFENKVGMMLSPSSGFRTDYSALFQYFLGLHEAPVEPTKRRRYLVGGAFAGATLYKSEFQKKCPMIEGDSMSSAEADSID